MAAENYHHKRRANKSFIPVLPKPKEGISTQTKQQVLPGKPKPIKSNSMPREDNSITRRNITSGVVPLPHIKRQNLQRLTVANLDRSKPPYKLEQAAKLEDQHITEETFGDLERICVKSWKEELAASDYDNDIGDVDLKDSLHHLLRLSGLYQDSVKETENIYNVLRATGLLNLCITVIDDENDELHEKTTQQLLNFERTVLKRVMKIRHVDTLHFWKRRDELLLIDDLDEMRDVFDADFALLIECIGELPDEDDLLEDEQLTTRQLLAEDKIIAVASVMEAEVFRRSRVILSQTFVQCLKLLGSLPCRYALITLKQNKCGFLTPYSPWSCFLLIEKNTAGAKSYYRNALTLFSMIIADIGETSLSNLSIRSLDWFGAALEASSGFAMCNHIGDATGHTKAMIDSIKSPDDLIRSATSSKIEERDKVYSICNGSKYITGDYKLFKELAAIRQMVIQRQQTDLEYAERILQKFENLVTAIDPIQNIVVSPSTDYQNRMSIAISTLLDIMFDLEKQLTAENTKERLEEITSANYYPPSSFLSLITEKRDLGLQSHFPCNLEDIVTPRLRQSLSRHNMGTFLEAHEPQPTVLRELKYVKTERLPIDSIDIRSQIMLSMSENAPKVHDKRESKLSLYSNSSEFSDAKLKGNKTKILALKKVPKNVTQPKNASNRVKAVEKLKTPPVETPILSTPDVVKELEPIEVFDRMVCSVPSFTGRQRSLVDGNTAHSWLLLHYLTDALQVSKSTKQLITTSHSPPRIDYTTLDQVYLKALQILLPIIDSLKDICKSAGNLASLRKMLYSNIDFSKMASELAVALVFYHNERYEESCQALYSYLEHRSDVTFIGEPFPSDLIEVSQELLEERKISRKSYEVLLILLANSQMKRKNFEDALSYWKMILIMTTDTETSADLNRQLANCYVALENDTDALETATRALSLYEELPRRQKSQQCIEELREIIDGIED